MVQHERLESREFLAGRGAEEHALAPALDRLGDASDVVFVSEGEEEIRLVEDQELEAGREGALGEEAAADALGGAGGGGDEDLRGCAGEFAEDAPGTSRGGELAGADESFVRRRHRGVTGRTWRG